MSAKGIKAAKAATKRISRKVANEMAERGILAASSILEVASAYYTPIDTSTLINSQFLIVEKGAKGWQGRVGYTVEYAAALHRLKGKLKGKPRAHFGMTSEGVEFGGGTGVGNYWDPNAEPQFLTLAATEQQATMLEAFIEEMKL